MILSLEQQLADSTALAEVAERAGVSLDHAKAIVRELAEVPIEQQVRMYALARRMRRGSR